ncbi:MAG TPA: sigma-54 dependent transcriptional regulator [Alphaproteobacteria bacterium]|nr:sigma-54 dependent transcriptional regulator [Alphaproteobacteria bacterium]
MNHDILIVDDEADIRLLMSGILQDEGYATREAADSDAALASVRTRKPSLVLLDIWLKNSKLDGMQILGVLRREHPDLPVIMISGHGNVQTAVAAIKEGAYDYIEKPFKSDRLLVVVSRAVEAALLKRENQELKLRVGADADLIGQSTPIRQLEAAVERVAPTNSRVLISGPPGSGKEVVARLIHRRSARATGPFVAVNCAIMDPDRLEAELFGVESSSVADGRRTGMLESAHGGTLFLDEVADMPIATQGKIVRILQEQTFERVGGNIRVQVDVRVLAATNRDLKAEIGSERFREDLFYRLNVVPLRVPSLKERREDVPLLVRHFMRHAALASGLSEREIGDDAMTALQAHEWPGNVRQLRNVIEWLLIMTPGEGKGRITAEMLPPEILNITPAVLRWEKGDEMMRLPLREAREVFEREYLAAQIVRFGGNVSRTAAFVGMERSALHRKLKSLGLGSAVNGQERQSV